MVMVSEEETDRIRIRIGQSVGEAVRKIIKEENLEQTHSILEAINRDPKVKDVKDDNPKETKCPFDYSSKFSMLDELNEDFYRLNSDLTTLRTKTEAYGQIIKELSSDHQALWSDHQQVKGDVKQIKEMVRVHGERFDDVDKMLYALRSEVNEDKARIAKLEEHTNTLNAQLDEEKRQREKSDSGIWDFLGFLMLLGLIGLSQRKIAESQARKELTLEGYVKAKYG